MLLPYGIPRFNGCVDVLWSDISKKVRKPEPAWNGGSQDQLAILRGEADLGAGPQAHLFSRAAWNPHSYAASPFLNLRLHPKRAAIRRLYHSLTRQPRLHLSNAAP